MSSANDMVLDPELKLVVCKACSAQRKAAAAAKFSVKNTPSNSFPRLSDQVEKKTPVRNTPMFGAGKPSMAVQSSEDRFKKKSLEPQVKLVSNKPDDWDFEDEELEKAARKQAQQGPKIDKESNTYACPKCNYQFKKNIGKVYYSCPFCGASIH
jgi:rubrerythrin